MNSPEIDGPGILAAGDLGPHGLERLANLRWHLAGELHVEAELANAPGDEMACVGNAESEKAVDGKAGGLGAHQRRRAPVREEQEGEHLLEVLSLLQVERAEFEIENEDGGVGSGSDDMARGLERIHGGIAAHEADHGALDRGAQAEMMDDVEVEARRVESGARSDDDVRDAAALIAGDGQLVERAARELRGKTLEELHAARSIRKSAAHVEVLGVAPGAVLGYDGLDEGVAMFDG